MKNPGNYRRTRFFFLWTALLWVWIFGGVKIVSGASATENEEEHLSRESSASGIQEELMEDLDLQRVQELMDDMLQGESFSVTKAVRALMSGEEVFSKEAVQKFLQGLFFDRLYQERATFFKILFLVLIAALFANFSSVFESGQIGEVSFYMVYLLLFMMIMDSFSTLSVQLEDMLSWMTEFMKSLAPAYFIAVSASSGAATAAVFYEGVLILTGLIQWVMKSLLLPGVNLYVLICMVNHLSKEEMLGKMTEFLKMAVDWGLKTMLGFMAGLHVVRGLISPVIDSLKRSAIGKTASAIPGVGGAVNAVTEIIVTSAVLVRNSMGVIFLLVLFFVGAKPLIHYGLLSLAYRFLAALSQPVSDKRLVGCLSTFGEGAALLLRILISAQVLCMIAFVILMVSFGGGT